MCLPQATPPSLRVFVACIAQRIFPRWYLRDEQWFSAFGVYISSALNSGIREKSERK